MNKIVKYCKIHGNLLPELIYFRNDRKVYECKLCKNERSKKYAINNPEKNKKYHKEWRNKNKDKMRKKNNKWAASEKGKKYRKNYSIKNKENIRRIAKKTREKNKKNINLKKKNSVEKLTDSYIKDLICNNSHLKTINIPDELIQIKKIHLKLKRKIKELNNGN